MVRGRKPASAQGKKRQLTIHLSPEEVKYLEAEMGTARAGLFKLLREAMERDRQRQQAGAPSYTVAKVPRTDFEQPTPVVRAKADGRERWCERCRRVGVPSCPACQALARSVNK